MEHSDEDLINQFQEGNRQAMEMLFTRYKTRLFNFSLRLLANRADAEDVTSEVFLKLISGQFSFVPQAKFSTWLFTVARNRCIDVLRKNRNDVSLRPRSNENPLAEIDVVDGSANSREDIIRQETAQQIQHALQQLPFDQKEAIVLREYCGFNYEQIAQVLNCSLDNVKILIFRGRQTLRTKLHSLLKEDGHE